MEQTRLSEEQKEKYELLKDGLRELGSVAVAFSGGADSALLLYAAREALGDRAVAVTVRSCLSPEREMGEAEQFCLRYGIRHIFCEVDPLKIEGFAANPRDRCYICKREIFGRIRAAAAAVGIGHIAEGSNMDDRGDYRPGMRAIAELGIESPLLRAGFTKADIRAVSGYLGLPTGGKPSMACLASRFVYGETISREKLDMVDKAEQLLLDMGFHQFRVRIHGMMARIEILPEEFPKLLAKNIRENVYARFKSLGFTYVTLDLKGYRTGSMNETL